MIDLYTAATPNGYKISIMLEEIGLPYRLIRVNLGASEQKTPEFLAMNPNGRIPVIVDREEDDFTVIESGAILVYLAEKSGQLLPQASRERSEVLQWVMFQMGGVGPMMGQANVWFRYFHEEIPAAINRYQHESRRLLEVLNTRLQGRSYLCSEYSIADIANWCWAVQHNWSGVSTEGLDDLQGWLERVAERPAVEKGRNLPPRASKSAVKQTGEGMIVT